MAMVHWPTMNKFVCKLHGYIVYINLEFTACVERPKCVRFQCQFSGIFLPFRCVFKPFSCFHTYCLYLSSSIEVLNGMNKLDIELFGILKGYPCSIYNSWVVLLPRGTWVQLYRIVVCWDWCGWRGWRKYYAISCIISWLCCWISLHVKKVDSPKHFIMSMSFISCPGMFSLKRAFYREYKWPKSGYLELLLKVQVFRSASTKL